MGVGAWVEVGVWVEVEVGAAEAKDTVPNHNKVAKTKLVSLFIFFKAIVQTDLIAQIISIDVL
ncbi:hypothetical protein H6G81_17330 [Scytonema hofmannii FACHB-248]|uniref:Uncharacterized protein n=1 Tax=Scytonema hofmannii FACHB-248 TaxID=1842502 RepID=A0ABR8GSC8_9CYAN|nr:MULTISPECIES: hypothetical protein [Nostocales]MBD2606243.1 hypothetical protein [Scytonema hofmannii FACHB-248]